MRPALVPLFLSDFFMRGKLRYEPNPQELKWPEQIFVSLNMTVQQDKNCLAEGPDRQAQGVFLTATGFLENMKFSSLEAAENRINRHFFTQKSL